jgi:hypothetical protein
VAPPTFRLATPPVSLAKRSWNFSLSYWEVLEAMLFLISSMRSLSWLLDYF